MTIAQQFIAECKGKTVDEISDIEDKYEKDGLYDGDEGLYSYLCVRIAPYSISNHDNRFDIQGEDIFTEMDEDDRQYLEDGVEKWLDSYSGLDLATDFGVYEDEDGLQMYAFYDEAMDGEGGIFEIPIGSSIVQEIADDLDLGSIDIGIQWYLTFSWSVGNLLDLSSWLFNDGSSCDWNDLKFIQA